MRKIYSLIFTAVLSLFTGVTQSQPTFTANDFQCFLDKYVAKDPYANCDGVGGLTANDFLCFLNAYVAKDPYANCDGSVTSVGWTTFTQDNGSHTLYVSASGTGDCTRGSPCSLSTGLNLWRDNSTDWMLFRAGDSWTFNSPLQMTKGNNTPGKYLRIGSWGTGNLPRLIFNGCSGISGEVLNKSGLAITDVEIVGDRTANTGGIRILGWKNILIEGVYVRSFADNIIIQGQGIRSTGIKVRRTTSADSNWNGGGPSNKSQGIFMASCDGWLIEECNFLQNGILGSIFSHGAYIQGGQGTDEDCGPGDFIGNIAFDNASEGVQDRPGGNHINNLYAKNSYGAYMDQVGICNWNSIIGCKDISPTLLRGRGLLIVGNYSGRGNFAGYNKLASGQGNTQGFDLSGMNGSFSDGVVYDWHNPTFPEGRGFVSGNSVTLTNCTAIQIVPAQGNGQAAAWCFQGGHGSGNKGFFNGASNVDNTATLGTRLSVEPADPKVNFTDYMTSIGMSGGEDEFMAQVRLQTHQRWDVRFTAPVYNSWLRNRVGIVGGP